MAWKECFAMQERERFIVRALVPGVNFSQLCREFGISRKTGYKWLARFREQGTAGLRDRSRRPHAHPWAVSVDIALEVIRIRLRTPSWGPYPIRCELLGRYPAGQVPSERTIGRIIEQAGLVRKRRRRRSKQNRLRKMLVAKQPNDVWTIDFKGWWRTRDGTRCEPLTIRDAYSQFLLVVDALPSTKSEYVQASMSAAFEQYGLPKVIHSDNGTPFASTRGLCGLTRLSVWWLSYGIHLDRGRPGCPQDNAAHERMHQDMAAVLEANPAATLSGQQEDFDRWRYEYNVMRKRKSLDGKAPADVYQVSPRVYTAEPPQFDYPKHFETRYVKRGGTIQYCGKESYVSQALAGQHVAIEVVSATMLRVWFHDVCLGLTDRDFQSPLRPTAYEAIENNKL